MVERKAARLAGEMVEPMAEMKDGRLVEWMVEWTV